MSERTLGEQLTDELAIDGGSATIHANGLTLTGSGVTATAWWGLLGIGRPVMVSGDPAAAMVMILEVEAAGPGISPEAITALVSSALAGRVALTPTATGGPAVDLVVAPAEHGPKDLFVVPITAPAMAERVLYDVSVVGGPVVAPHAVYFRREWRDFGLAHVTDTHVARRIDQFRAMLVEAGRPEAARAMVSFNDRFRGFVKYANYLHDEGILDLIVVTGDLYDYIHEQLVEPGPSVNPELLRDLILGRSDSPEFIDIEELRIPIFLIAGNHDYRIQPYHLIFDIQAPLAGGDLERVSHYESYNLGPTEAAILTNRLYPKSFGGVPIEEIPISDADTPNVSHTTAANMVSVDKTLREYRRYLGDPTSHTVVLGDHRIVLFDSGPDEGVVDSLWEFLGHKFGLAGEDEATFLGGSPNCAGPSQDNVDEVARVLREVPPHGLVIVASHAPVINVWGTEYPYYLRETQRRHQPDQVTAFLARLTPDIIHKEVHEVHRTWFGSDASSEVDFVKRGNYDDMMDHGVSRGDTKRLLHVLVGVDLPRAADLVLTGHTHRDNEFVVRRLPGGEPAMFHDYYTENPGTYYPAIFATSVGKDPTFSRTWLTVAAGADPGGTPTVTPSHDFTHELVVPPYANPLNDSGNPAAWWESHRPLILQTGALGPISRLREYAGFRVIEVADNVIKRISRVPIERLEQSGWTLDWETARAPIPVTRAPEPPWLTVSEGATSPGGRVSAAAVDDQVALFLVDPNGGVYTASGRVKRWTPWFPVSQGSTVPGGTVTAVVDSENFVDLLLADAGGGVYACRGRGTSWSGWVNVSEGSTTPGAPVTAVAGDDGLISLFLADPAGGVYTCRGVGDHWGPWSTVSEGSTTPGAPITAVADFEGRINLFLANPEGGVYTCRGFGSDWSGWSSVSEGGTVPGGTLTAVLGQDGTINLFLANVAGELFTCRGFGTAWGSWATVSQGSTQAGAAVAVFPTTTLAAGHLGVVLADPAGGVYFTTGVSDQWGMWAPLAEGTTRAGAPITAVQLSGSPPVTTLVMAGPHGGVLAKRMTL
jgi:hypothetical protein